MAMYKCPTCNKAFRGKYAKQALGGHVRTHAGEVASGAPTRRRKRGRRPSPAVQEVSADLKLAGMVQDFYPGGIPTADKSQLLGELRFIGTLSQKLREGLDA